MHKPTGPVSSEIIDSNLQYIYNRSDGVEISKSLCILNSNITCILWENSSYILNIK